MLTIDKNKELVDAEWLLLNGWQKKYFVCNYFDTSSPRFEVFDKLGFVKVSNGKYYVLRTYGNMLFKTNSTKYGTRFSKKINYVENLFKTWHDCKNYLEKII